MLNIVIFGAPGSGKGTYSARIKETFNLEHISTGDVLRAEIKNGTDLGRTAKGYIDNGQLIPDELMIGILANVYDHLPTGCNGVILDGFPRTIAQAEALKAMLDERGEKLASVVSLNVSEDILMFRLLRRATIEGRADDNEETIRKRFAVYYNQTKPLEEFFRNEGLLKEFTYTDEIGPEGMIKDITEYIKTL